MLSKSLIQFSVDGRSYVPSLLFDLRPNMVEVMKIMATSFHRSSACTAAGSAPTVATVNPRLCWRLLDPHGQVWVSLLWGHCSFLLGPGAHKVLCPPRVCFSPVLGKFWQLYGGVIGNPLQEDLYHTQVCCTQSPCPCSRPLPTCTFAGDTQTEFWLSLCRVSGS